MKKYLSRMLLSSLFILGSTASLMAFGLGGLTDGLKKLEQIKNVGKAKPAQAQSGSSSGGGPSSSAGDEDTKKQMMEKANQEMLLKNQMPFGDDECLIEYVVEPLKPIVMEEKRAVMIGDIKVMGDSEEIKASTLKEVRRELISQLKKGNTFSEVMDKEATDGELGDNIYYITGSIWSKYDLRKKTTYKRDTKTDLSGQKDIIVPINFQVIKCFLKVNLSLKEIVKTESGESVEQNITSVSDTASFRFKLQGSRKVNFGNFINREVQQENTESFIDESLLSDFELGKWAVKKFLRQFSATPELVRARIGGSDPKIVKLIHDSKLDSFKKALEMLQNKGAKSNSDFYNIALCHEGLGDYIEAAKGYNEVLTKDPNNNSYLAGRIRVGTRL
jgi:hypothetical protein